MGVNMIKTASPRRSLPGGARQEIIRRYYAARCGQVQGRTEQAEVDRLKMIVQKAGLGPEDRPVIAAARKREEETAAPPGH